MKLREGAEKKGNGGVLLFFMRKRYTVHAERRNDWEITGLS
jgi:hypothetical protein